MSDFNQYKKIIRTPFRYIPVMIMAYLSLNLLGLVLPLAMKKIYGTIILSKSVSSLRFILIGVFVALLLEAILKKVKDSSSKWIASVYEYKLSNFLVEKISDSYDLKDHRNYISDLEKFNSIATIAQFYSSSIYQLFIDLPFMALYLYLIFLFGKILVIVPVILAIIYVIIITFNTYFYAKSRRVEIENSNEILRILTETLEKIHFVKAAGIEASQIRQYKEKLTSVTESNFICNNTDNVSKIISSNYGQITLFSILVGGGFPMSKGLMTFGAVTACSMLGSRAMSPVISIMGHYQQYHEIKILSDRIEEIILRPNQYDNDVSDFPEDIYGTIEVINLGYTNSQTREQEFISCTISKNEFISINPRTFISYQKLLNKICGKEKISSGKVLIDSLDISQWNMNTLKGKIAYLKSTVNLIKGSVLDNITFYDNSKSQNAYIASTLTGLDDLVSQMAEGYETQLDSYSVNQLSAAFLQRLNLTRAFVDRPRILILDRLEEGMDKITQKNYYWLLEQLKGLVTIIIVTEQPELLNLVTHQLTPDGLI